MFDIVKRLFIAKPTPDRDEQYRNAFAEKRAGLERLLGPMIDADEAPIPLFHMCDGVALYFFDQCAPGTAMATMELIQPFMQTPRSRRTILYELVAFTRHSVSVEETGEMKAFDNMAMRIRTLFTTVARYSTAAVIKPGDCCEIPLQKDKESACMVFVEYTRGGECFHIASEKYCLLLGIEVHRSEMEYARQCGVAALVEKLQAAGHYPYSDLDRESVV